MAEAGQFRARLALALALALVLILVRDVTRTTWSRRRDEPSTSSSRDRGGAVHVAEPKRNPMP